MNDDPHCSPAKTHRYQILLPHLSNAAFAYILSRCVVIMLSHNSTGYLLRRHATNDKYPAWVSNLTRSAGIRLHGTPAAQRAARRHGQRAAAQAAKATSSRRRAIRERWESILHPSDSAWMILCARMRCCMQHQHPFSAADVHSIPVVIRTMARGKSLQYHPRLHRPGESWRSGPSV